MLIGSDQISCYFIIFVKIVEIFLFDVRRIVAFIVGSIEPQVWSKTRDEFCSCFRQLATEEARASRSSFASTFLLEMRSMVISSQFISSLLDEIRALTFLSHLNFID